MVVHGGSHSRAVDGPEGPAFRTGASITADLVVAYFSFYTLQPSRLGHLCSRTSWLTPGKASSVLWYFPQSAWLPSCIILPRMSGNTG